MRSRIIIMGLGPGGIELLPLRNWEVLQSTKRIYLRTARHPIAKDFVERGLTFDSFDRYYLESESFDECYRKVVDKIFVEAQNGPIVYAVPGHPLVAEETVMMLRQQAPALGIEVEILSAMSFLDVLFTTLGVDPIQGLNILDALQLDKQKPVAGVGNIITQVYNPMVASEVKLTLMDYYPDDQTVMVVQAAGIPGQERVKHIPLYELDRLPWIDHLTTVYIPPTELKVKNCNYPLDPLVDILARLRSPDGCPWDKEQTHESLKPYLIEEAYEVLEAIDERKMDKICEELGDLLLQIVFHAQIGAENEYFNINDVILEITEKMVRRHPHVFGEIRVANSKEVTVNWEKIKAKEREAAGVTNRSVMSGIPKSLPALLRAEKIQKKAAKVGFDWPDYRGAWHKVQEELREAAKALADGNLKELQEELGDLLFAITNVCRHLGIDPEASLNKTNEKFLKRFNFIEEEVKRRNQTIGQLSLVELDKIWERSKEEKWHKS